MAAVVYWWQRLFASTRQTPGTHGGGRQPGVHLVAARDSSPTLGTSGLTPLTNEIVEALAEESEAGYDVDRFRPRATPGVTPSFWVGLGASALLLGAAALLVAVVVVLLGMLG